MSKRNHANGDEVRAALAQAASERILVLDGAMGTDDPGSQSSTKRPISAAQRFADWPRMTCKRQQRSSDPVATR